MRISRSLTYHDQVRTLRIIFFALFTAQAMLFLAAWIVKGNIELEPEAVNVLDYLIPIMLFGTIFLSRILYRRITSGARTSPFVKKLEAYRNAVIVNLAVLEGGNTAAIIAFMVTGEYIYAAASLIMFLLFMLNSPTLHKFTTDLELTPEEISHTE